MNPPTLPNAAEMGYSQISVVEPGRLAFVSGQVAQPAGGGDVPSSLTDQAKLVVKNAKAALDALGATPHDVAMVRIYMVDLTDARQQEMFPYLIEMFDGAQPSVTGIGVAALASPDYQVEVEMIARLPDGT
ncbi:RidA family protein [Cognatiyoonia sp. IB215182]|uniref:RidA family protein n=1 Tax=Cognatiyoonia sp. IB215182 TaxID=3097353 RepID=UPI002A0AA816|nr:RidA family protein [Cognatiyoonia sp. IB215182]MDX8354517.1 RidA family protein [Cognatiyoonia sp. IB215182]